jgi:ribosomal protein S20
MNRTGISALALAAVLAFPVGPALAATGSTQAQRARFCAAVSQWGLSPAVRQLQDAVQEGDKRALQAAFKSWSDETQAMVDALPSDAPKPAKRGFVNLNKAIQSLARGRSGSKAQLKVYRKSRGPVLAYYGRTCG